MASINNIKEEEVRKKIIENILETSYSYADDADNPQWLDKKMKKYLLDIIVWYYEHDLQDEDYAKVVDIERVKETIIKGYYKRKDRGFLNELKMVILKVEVDRKAYKAQSDMEMNDFDSLFN